MTSTLIIGILVSYLAISQANLVIQNRSYETVSTEFWYDGGFKVSTFSVCGDIVFYNQNDGSVVYTDKIVFVDSFTSADSVARLLKDEGAAVMVLGVHLLGSGGIFLSGPRVDLAFPSLEILDDDLVEIKRVMGLNEGNLVGCASTSPHADELFQRYYTEAVFVNVALGPYFVIVFFIILYNIGMELRDVGFEWSLKILIGFYLVFITLYRLAIVTGDSLTKYRAIGWATRQLLVGGHLFLSILGTVIITVYWFEVVNRGIMELKFLRKISVPYYIVVIVYSIGIVGFIVVSFVDEVGGFYDTYSTAFFIILLATFFIMDIFQLTVSCVITGRQRKLEKKIRRERKSAEFALKLVVSSILQLFLIPLYLLHSNVTNDILSTIFVTIYWVFSGADSLIILSLIEWGRPKSTTMSTDNNSRKTSHQK
eukprot:TRINITY_DN257_c0_g1_i1.p1 TRINITY_DN257_c0_g1~~TRINITY_DN257_c0_g1_i1.p1  ORF type:complete len:425 (-),score=54.78 TRINITY_DN257_c0_g1_i1:32-1306(-)